MALAVAGGCDLNGGNEVFLAVCTRDSYRKLASGEYDRLGKSLDHKAHCRCRVSHSVGSVQDHESVIFVILLFDKFCDGYPQCRFDIR